MNRTFTRAHTFSVVTVVALLVAGILPADGTAQDYKTHTVKTGDTLYRIARQNYVTVQSLRELNRISDDVIQPGQLLWIDGRPPDDSLASVVVDSVSHLRSESTTSDSVAIASTENDPAVSPAQEVLAADSLFLARPTLTSAVPTDTLQDASGPISHHHIVERGETLFAIADRYGVSVDTLAVANPLHATYLSAGDTIRVPWGMQFGKHRIRSGETLFRISRLYGTTVQRVQELNNLRGTNISAGQQLVVPLRPTDAETLLAVEPEIVGSGIIGVYPEMFEGRLMANGKPYLPEKFSASHPDLPLGTIVLLIDPSTGRQTFAEITDRLPSGSEVIMEVSMAVASVLELQNPMSPVEVRRVR